MSPGRDGDRNAARPEAGRRGCPAHERRGHSLPVPSLRLCEPTLHQAATSPQGTRRNANTTAAEARRRARKALPHLAGGIHVGWIAALDEVVDAPRQCRRRRFDGDVLRSARPTASQLRIARCGDRYEGVPCGARLRRSPSHRHPARRAGCRAPAPSARSHAAPSTGCSASASRAEQLAHEATSRSPVPSERLLEQPSQHRVDRLGVIRAPGVPERRTRKLGGVAELPRERSAHPETRPGLRADRPPATAACPTDRNWRQRSASPAEPRHSRASHASCVNAAASS